MTAENAWWALEHGEINDCYFAYGLDQKRGPRARDFLSQREWIDTVKRQIHEAGAHGAEGLLKDKLAFATFATSRDVPTPRNLAVLHPDIVEWLDPRRWLTYDEALAHGGDLDGFCKPIGGQHGTGAFRLDIRDGQARLDGRTVGAAELRTRVAEPLVLQERVEQHEALARLHPSSLNTIRLVTVLPDGASQAVPFSAMLRVGRGGSVVDNLSARGFAVMVDINARTLRGAGVDIASGGERFEAHPDTGVVVDGYPIPFLGEGIEMACRLHREVGKLRTVGWDLAIARAHPTVIEGNTFWGCRGFSAAQTNFKPRLLALYP